MKCCAGCNFKIPGRGCTLTNQKVEDEGLCNEWIPIDRSSIHDQDAIEQYRRHGMILDLGA